MLLDMLLLLHLDFGTLDLDLCLDHMSGLTFGSSCTLLGRSFWPTFRFLREHSCSSPFIFHIATVSSPVRRQRCVFYFSQSERNEDHQIGILLFVSDYTSMVEAKMR